MVSLKIVPDLSKIHYMTRDLLESVLRSSPNLCKCGDSRVRSLFELKSRCFIWLAWIYRFLIIFKNSNTLKRFPYLFYVYFAWVCVCAQNMSSTQGGGKRGSDSLELELRWFGPPCGCWNLNLGSLQEQMELSLQLQDLAKSWTI